MKIILLQNVSTLGKTGEIKDVKDGYALNYLIPKDLAVLPNDPKAAELLKQKKLEYQKKEKLSSAEQESFNKINGKKFVFKTKTDAKGNLYGSIGPKEIAQKMGISEKLITERFKKVGTYELKINFGTDKLAEVKIEIKKN